MAEKFMTFYQLNKNEKDDLLKPYQQKKTESQPELSTRVSGNVIQNVVQYDVFSVGDEFNFGRYNLSPIRWKVIDIDKKNNVLLAIATCPVNSGKKTDLKWLNESFYKYSFNGMEKDCIVRGNKDSDKLSYVSCFKTSVFDIDEAEEEFLQKQPDFLYWENNHCVFISKITDNANEYDCCVPALHLKIQGLSSKISDFERMIYLDSDFREKVKQISPELERIIYLDSEFNVKIRQLSVGDKFEFGKYNGKAIVWRVLKTTYFTVTLISEENICDRPFNSDRTTNCWDKCTLREWLNGEFYETAFDETEKRYIIDTFTHDTCTRDKIFLLGKEEANLYFKDEKERSTGLCWWLRTPIKTTRTERINGDGSFSKDGSATDDSLVGVRPLLRLILKNNNSMVFRGRL